MKQTMSKLILIICLVSIIRSCDDLCLECSTMGTCNACKGTAEFDIEGKCVSSVIDKCVTYGPDKQCFVCQPTFSLKN